MLYLITLTTFLSTWIFGIALLFMIFNRERPIDRLKNLEYRPKEKKNKDKSRQGKTGVITLLSGWVPSFRWNRKKARATEMELLKADIPMTLEELFIIKLLSSAILGFFIYVILRSPIATGLIVILIWNTPKFIIRRKKKVRIKEFDHYLTDGINILVNSLKAGYSFLQSIAVVTKETKGPFAKEFNKLLKEMSLGISEEEALKNLMERMESEDLRLMMNAILIQKDIGGNLAEILDNISETIRARQAIRNEVKTLTAQGKLSGVIVTLLPVLLGVAIYVLNPDYMRLLFTETLGLVMVGGAVMSQLIGIMVIRKIINIDL